MKTHSLNQEMKEARSVSRRVVLLEMKTHGQGYHTDLELSDRSRE